MDISSRVEIAKWFCSTDVRRREIINTKKQREIAKQRNNEHISTKEWNLSHDDFVMPTNIKSRPGMKKNRVYMRIFDNFVPCWKVSTGWVAVLSSARAEFQLGLLHVNTMKAYTVNRVETQPVLKLSPGWVSSCKGPLRFLVGLTVWLHADCKE